MNRFLSVLSIWFMLLSCSTQQAVVPTNVTDPTADPVLQGNIKDLAIDELGFIYLLTQDNQLHRCNADFKVLFTYSNKRLGNIQSIDSINLGILYIGK